jgi:hypothetical protein
VSRRQWVKGYVQSEGNPMQRYSLPFSSFFWLGLIALSFLSIASAGYMILY